MMFIPEVTTYFLSLVCKDLSLTYWVYRIYEGTTRPYQSPGSTPDFSLHTLFVSALPQSRRRQNSTDPFNGLPLKLVTTSDWEVSDICYVYSGDPSQLACWRLATVGDTTPQLQQPSLVFTDKFWRPLNLKNILVWTALCSVLGLASEVPDSIPHTVYAPFPGGACVQPLIRPSHRTAERYTKVLLLIHFNWYYGGFWYSGPYRWGDFSV